MLRRSDREPPPNPAAVHLAIPRERRALRLVAVHFGFVRERSESVLGSAIVHGMTNACFEVYRHIVR